MEKDEKQLAEFNKLLDEFKEKCPPKPVYEPTYLELCEYPWKRLEEICSRLFAFFFDTRNPHGFGTLFFDTLLEVYQEKYSAAIEVLDKKNILYTQSVCAETEKCTEKGNRMDLLLTADCLKVCVENKIDAFPNNDFDDYYNSAKKESELFNLHTVCILLALCEKAEYENVNPNFKTIYYREFLEKLKQNLNDYLNHCNSKYLSYLNDFIHFLERKGGYMSELSEKERNFFIDKDKELGELLERREKFLSEQKKLLEKRIENIQSSLNQKEHDSLSGDWWNGGLYLGGHFKKGDKQYELGIEAGFTSLVENRFNISVSIWKWDNQKNRINLYRPKLKDTFEILKDDKTSGKWYVVVKELDACDDGKIVSELCDVYKKVENIVNDAVNQT
ncbi:PD-(D/E)XK nuclease family protein [Fibrobacter sp. UWB11]|uniref:PD-(D/E)XK nuclease family protein n=1 Tax=Fibrobacter sp. UWB11 TaxID=1896202 RepID=UPI00092BCD8D|nr:PD-(D/E)XK nuclease family protein [Fibrobacter sp. UWB11]SIO39440.1 PD-(D/E)XK nuclease superfamily protein [Fibrobacter sp. UWB11]